MNSFSPRENFQKFHEPEALHLRSQVTQRWLLLALETALAETANGQTTTGELQGIQKFIDVFLNLGEKRAALEKWPERKLSSNEPPKPESK